MNNSKYDFAESQVRIGQVMERSGEDYWKYAYFPDIEELNKYKGAFVDGVMVACRLIFIGKNIDLLSLAKVYEAYISEAKAILEGSSALRNVTIDGHFFRGIYNMSSEGAFDEVLDISARLISLADVVNVKAGRKDDPLISAVCAIECGAMFVANLSDGLIFSGNMATRIEGYLMDPTDKNRGIFLTDRVFEKLKDDYKAFFSPYNNEKDKFKLYYGSVENIGMARWVKEQK